MHPPKLQCSHHLIPRLTIGHSAGLVGREQLSATILHPVQRGWNTHQWKWIYKPRTNNITIFTYTKIHSSYTYLAATLPPPLVRAADTYDPPTFCIKGEAEPGGVTINVVPKRRKT